MGTRKRTLKMPQMTANDMEIEFERDQSSFHRPKMTRIKNAKYIGDSFTRKIKPREPSFREM